MELSRLLGDFIHTTSFSRLPDEVVEFTKLCVLDYLGSALAGAKEKPVQIIDRYVKEMGGEPHSTLFTGGKSSVANAALVNGASGHVLELDDIHKGSIIHAGTVVIPAALAVAEAKQSSGEELITAIAIGYDVCYRIGEAVSPSHYYYWHNTATCGTFGAAAAACKLLELEEEGIVHALGSAGTQAAGLWEFIEDGAMSKQLHTAKAAMNGVISAYLAEKGFTAARKILEGRRGFFEAMSDSYDPEKVTTGLGEHFKIIENSFKIHASCRHTHPAIDLMIEIKNNTNVDLEKIGKITVKAYQSAIDITNNPAPETVYAAKFSMQFCAALALIQGDASLNQFNETMLRDETICRLMERIEVIIDPDIDQQYPEKWGTEVTIQLKTGDVIVKSAEYPKGDPENPVTAKDLIDKFNTLTYFLPQEKRASLVEGVMNLEKVSDIRDLMKHVTGN